jgi:hypothetical protein
MLNQIKNKKEKNKKIKNKKQKNKKRKIQQCIFSFNKK